MIIGTKKKKRRKTIPGMGGFNHMRYILGKGKVRLSSAGILYFRVEDINVRYFPKDKSIRVYYPFGSPEQRTRKFADVKSALKFIQSVINNKDNDI